MWPNKAMCNDVDDCASLDVFVKKAMAIKRGGSRTATITGVHHHAALPTGAPPPRRFIIGGLVMTVVLALCAFTMVHNYATVHSRHSRKDVNALMADRAPVKAEAPQQPLTTRLQVVTSFPAAKYSSLIQGDGVMIVDEDVALPANSPPIALLPFPNGDTFKPVAGKSTAFRADDVTLKDACHSRSSLGVYDHYTEVNDGTIALVVCDASSGRPTADGPLTRLLLDDMQLEATLNEDYAEYLGPNRRITLNRGVDNCNVLLEWQTDADEPVVARNRNRTQDALVEGYQLCIDWPKDEAGQHRGFSLHISVWRPIGALHALRTFMQLAWSTRLDCSLPSHNIHRVVSGCVRDAPKVPYRGQHVDTARHFHTTNTIKGVLRAMSRLKLNRFHWHLSDDQGWRLESLVYPGLHTKGAARGNALNGVKGNKYQGLPYATPVYHTQDDVRDVMAYAQRRGIVVVPEVDLPAHAAALVAGLQVHNVGNDFGVRIDASRGNADCTSESKTVNGMTLAPNCMGGTFGVMHASKAAVAIAKNILGELCRVFSESPLIHIGGDEAEMLRDGLWGARSQPCDLGGCAGLGAQDFSAMQAVLMDELTAIIEDTASCPLAKASPLYSRVGSQKPLEESLLPRHTAVWDETVMELRKGRVPASKQVVPMLWRDDRISIDDIVQQYRAAGTQDPDDVQLVLTPKTRLYFDYLQHPQPASNTFWPLQRPAPWMKYKAVTLERSFMTHAMLPTAAAWRSSVVYGVGGCAWTELITNATVLDYQLFPRMYALADAAWTLRDPSSNSASLSRAFAMLQQKISVLEVSKPTTCRWLC